MYWQYFTNVSMWFLQQKGDKYGKYVANNLDLDPYSETDQVANIRILEIFFL
jgi:hypothetical protein